MKKLGVYSLLAAAMLFSTGCSEKNADMNVDGASTDSSANKGTSGLSDAGFSALEKAANGNWYMINGQRVLIEHVYFAFDKYNLTAENKDKATSNASKLSPLKADTTVTVSGNTDEWGSDEYNYALGLKRAEAVKTKLASEGVTDVSTVSYGESNPVCTEKTKECWAENRRAVSIAK